MGLHDYKCEQCGFTDDFLFKDAPEIHPDECPKCGKQMVKKVGGPFSFKDKGKFNVGNGYSGR